MVIHRRFSAAALALVLMSSCSPDLSSRPTNRASDGPATPVALGASGPREGFMLATDWRDGAAIASDVNTLANLGARIVRFPVYFNNEPSLAVWFARIDAVLPTIAARNMVIVIDFHQFSNTDDFVWRWGQVASRYRSNGANIWWDLLNEPSLPDWRQVALRAAQAIRQVDNAHRIVVAVKGTTTTPISSATPLPGISNQAIEVHFYNWDDVQKNGRPYPSAGRTREALRALLHECAVREAALGVPVYVGEVAITATHPNAPRFLRDFTSICDDEGLGLTVHAFREAQVWNYELNPAAWAVLTDWLSR